MQRLINIIIKYKEYITLVALVVMSLSFISMGEVSRLGGFRTFVIGGIGWFQDVFAWIPNPGALRSENQALRELNMQLSSEVIKMRKALIENQRLKGMLSLADTAGVPLLSAEVIGKVSVQMRNYVTINRGTAQGAHVGMAVRTDAGLVGTIISSTSKYSLVELLNNRNVKISAKIIRNQIEGIVGWDGGEYLLLQNIPQSFDVKIGDVIITSNYSTKFPTDVPIGRVAKVENEPGSLFHRIKIEPFAHFSSLEQVFVVEYIPDPDRFKLIEKIEAKLNDIRQGK